MKGKLFLIPCPIAKTNDARETLSPQVLEAIKSCDLFLVEELRTARRYISSLKLGLVIEELEFFQLNKKTKFEQLFEFMMNHTDKQLGVISEAGCPAVADPGSLAVEVAHQLKMKVVPLVGPSSILLTLMASGFNGQSFAFQGYLPIDRKARESKLKQLEKNALTLRQTQLFMDTPYRNNHVLESIISSCSPDTKLCVAMDVTGESEYIKTQSIGKWKHQKIDLNKKPVIFALHI
ncbi:MAG: SAM-dependent methyltransferase [Cyclobacteriaceae bacterium]